MLWWYLPFAVIANTYTTCPYRQAAVPVFHGHKGNYYLSESAEGRKLRKKIKSLLLFMTMHILLNQTRGYQLNPCKATQ
jgi:hypothetical protein